MYIFENEINTNLPSPLLYSCPFLFLVTKNRLESRLLVISKKAGKIVMDPRLNEPSGDGLNTTGVAWYRRFFFLFCSLRLFS